MGAVLFLTPPSTPAPTPTPPSTPTPHPRPHHPWPTYPFAFHPFVCTAQDAVDTKFDFEYLARGEAVPEALGPMETGDDDDDDTENDENVSASTSADSARSAAAAAAPAAKPPPKPPLPTAVPASAPAPAAAGPVPPPKPERPPRADGDAGAQAAPLSEQPQLRKTSAAPVPMTLRPMSRYVPNVRQPAENELSEFTKQVRDPCVRSRLVSERPRNFD